MFGFCAVFIFVFYSVNALNCGSFLFCIFYLLIERPIEATGYFRVENDVASMGEIVAIEKLKPENNESLQILSFLKDWLALDL